MKTLKLMLGHGEESGVNSEKANKMIRKKVHYMANEDLDVAEKFIDLVDILKNRKLSKNKALKDSLMRRQAVIGTASLSSQKTYNMLMDQTKANSDMEQLLTNTHSYLFN